jgi:hypothetical protein
LINLRYHIVSLVAVFLALGMGIVMGSTVIDRVTVDALNNKLDDVRNSTNAIRDDNGRLKDQIRQDQVFAETTRDELLRGHLKGVPVMVVAVAGVDRKPVDDLRAALVTAQATVEGTVWFTSKMRLAGDNDIRALAESLQLGVDRPDVVRRQALARLLAPRDPAAAEPSPLASLSASGFVTYDPPPAPTTTSTSTVPPTLASLPLAGTRYVVVSGAGAQVSDDLVAVPFVQAASQASTATGSASGPGAGSQPSTSAASSSAAAQPSGRVVAVEAGQDTQGGRAVFVGLLRGDPVVSTRVSTVDNLESAMGQTATILALEELAVPHFGHYGVGPGAQRILPAPAA